jgi:hypothetical protein
MPVGQKLAYAAVWRRALQRQLSGQSACSISVLAAADLWRAATLAEIERDRDYCRCCGRVVGGSAMHPGARSPCVPAVSWDWSLYANETGLSARAGPAATERAAPQR